MFRLTRWFAIGILGTTVLVAWLSWANREHTTPFGDRNPLPESERTLVKQHGEWRLSQRVPGGAWETILNWAQSGDKVRFAILPRGSERDTVHGRILADGEIIHTFEIPPILQWTDHEFVVPEGKSGEITVQFESENGFRLAWCEIARPNRFRPNVLIILVDTLRQDHLGCYGYSRDTSPAIDALARESARFTKLVPQSSWTRPSVASILTSCYPSVHGAIDRNTKMRAGLPTLAESLQKAGYETHAIMSNPSCLPYWNIGSEFDRIVDLVEANAEKQDDAILVDEAIRTITSCDGRPWFLYLHLMGPHSPYVAREPYRSVFCSSGEESSDTVQAKIDSYDAEIAYTDTQIGRMLEALRDKGQYANTCVILLADHGEQFYEHGQWGHGLSLYEEELRVPLLIKFPESQHAGKVIDELAEGIDIAPTVCDIAGALPDPRFQGVSLLPTLQGKTGKTFASAALSLEEKSILMARDGVFKYIDDRVARTESWFDLSNDPQEKTPLHHTAEHMIPVRDFARYVAALDSEGLNILVTGGSKRLGNVHGIIRGVDLDLSRAETLNPDLAIERNASGYEFNLDPTKQIPHMESLEMWYARSEQSSAHIRLPLRNSNALSLSLYLDGTPFPRIVLGGPSVKVAFPQSNISLQQIIAEPDRFDPAILPRETAAYVWYVPQSETIEETNMEPRIRDALTSLGYLN